MIIDSWLVDDGEVYDFDAHVARFVAGVRVMYGARVPDQLLTEAREASRQEGQWFPRLEFGADGCASLAVRPAPPRRASTVLAVTGMDKRRHPRLKGPDLEYLAQQREIARDLGADDALLLDARGAIVEGANCTLCSWDGDVLVVPDAPRLDSVTERFLIAAARDVRVDTLRLVDLRDRPLWALSSLHGPTEVTEIIAGAERIRPASADARPLRRAWRQAFRPV